MGYIPPYIPDNYLQTMKSPPVTMNYIEKIQPISNRMDEQFEAEKRLKKSKEERDLTGLGIYFDRYA